MMDNSIKKGALISYFTIFVNIVTGLLYTPWMIRQIGVSDYGLYALIISFLSYFLLDFGLGTAVSRYVSKYKEEGRVEEISNLMSVVIKVFVVIDFFIFLALFVCFFYISNIFTGLTAEEIEKFKIVYCIAGGFSLLTFPFSYLNGILIAFEKFVTLKTCDLAQRLLIVLLVVISLCLGYGLYALVFVNSSIGLLMAIYKIVYISKWGTIKIKFKFFNWQLLKELLKFSAWVFVISIASRLMYNIIPTLLGRYSNSVEISKFSIAMMIEGYVYTFAGALNGLFLPKVMRLTINPDSGDKLTELMIRVGRFQLVIVGAIITGFLLLGKNFVLLWLGDGFEISYWVTMCLITPGIISLIEEIGNTALIAANELKYRAFLFIGASIISMVGGYFLIPYYGALGAGIAVNISLIFCHIIGMNVLYARKLKVNILKFFKKSIVSYLPIVFLSMFFAFILSRLNYDNTWLSFILVACCYVVVYLVLVWLLFLNRDEKSMFLSIITKR